jgi:hypothetical protein
MLPYKLRSTPEGGGGGIVLVVSGFVFGSIFIKSGSIIVLDGGLVERYSEI